MLTKDERRELRTAFWGNLAKRMDETSSASGRKVNWLNYPTGIRGLFVRMEFDEAGVRFCIDMQQRDLGVRELLYEQFEEFKKMLETSLVDEVIWKKEHILADSKFVSSRIYTERSELKFINKDDWPEAWDFLQSQLIGFDEFWDTSRDVFIGLLK